MSTYGSYQSGCYRADCGGRVCLTGAQHADARENGTRFFCSFGHSQVFSPPRRTYGELERQVRGLQSDNRRLVQSLVDMRFEFATCPFNECRQRRNDYIYATQSRLLDHLSKMHGVDVAAAVRVANFDHQTSLAS